MNNGGSWTERLREMMRTAADGALDRPWLLHAVLVAESDRELLPDDIWAEVERMGAECGITVTTSCDLATGEIVHGTRAP